MTSRKNIIEIGRNTIRKEAASVAALEELLDDQFEKAVELIYASKGRVIVSGIGKSAIVAQKIVATFNSTGTPAAFLHAAEAIHGDLGMIQEQDVVMLLSKSGESPEIKMLLSFIGGFGNPLIGMVGNLGSGLARQSDIVLNAFVAQEACLHNLAPTSSTTVQMVLGDALAVALMEMRGFGSGDFARLHPGGTLGKKLYLRVQELYIHNEKPQVSAATLLRDVIMEITSKRLGATAVTDGSGDGEGKQRTGARVATAQPRERGAVCEGGWRASEPLGAAARPEVLARGRRARHPPAADDRANPASSWSYRGHPRRRRHWA